MITEADKKWLAEIEPTYTSRIDLSGRSLTSFVGPTQVGKSFVIGDIVGLSENKGFDSSDEDSILEVDTITTRKARDNDPSGYRTDIPHTEMLERIRNEELVQWALFETGDIYGTDEKSYMGRHNLLPTQEKAIPMLARASFNNMNIIAVVRPVDEWRACFPPVIEDQKIVDRLEEAKKSLDFGMFTETPGIIQIVNYPDAERRAKTAEALVKIVKSALDTYTSDILPDYHAREYERHNRDMWEEADRMIKQARVKS